MSTMVRVKTAELTGTALDWAVAQGAGIKVITDPNSPRQRQMIEDTEAVYGWYCYSPSTDWNQGGPILDAVMKSGKWEIVQGLKVGEVDIQNHDSECMPVGSTGWDEESVDFPSSSILVAACRAFVYAKHGDAIEVPQELLG